MATAHKERNAASLVLLVTLNAVILYGLVTTQRAEPGAWFKTLTDLQAAVPAAVALTLTGILNGILTPQAKARLVFCQWEHPLPGCQAFSRYLLQDPRIDVARLEAAFGPFPSEPIAQNRRWYAIYQTVQTHPSVADASRSFLLSRDYAGLVALMLPLNSAVALLLLRSPMQCILYMGFLLLQLLMASRAARTNGVRLVTNAMAIASNNRED